MKLDDIESELVANYLEEYLEYLEYLYNNIGALYQIYKMDPDTEKCRIEATLEMLRGKIKSIREVKDLSTLKDLVRLKRLVNDGLEKGGTMHGR